MDLWGFDIKILLLLFPLLMSALSSISGSGKYVDDFLSTLPIKQLTDVQMLDANESDSEAADGCREASLHKCGSSMVRVFRLLDYLPWQKSYSAKCSLRKAFFGCLRTEDSPCRKRHWRGTADSRFRKKLVQSLWSTRGCILGSLPNGTHV